MLECCNTLSRKTCQGHTLELIGPVRKLQKGSFVNLAIIYLSFLRRRPFPDWADSNYFQAKIESLLQHAKEKVIQYNEYEKKYGFPVSQVSHKHGSR